MLPAGCFQRTFERLEARVAAVEAKLEQAVSVAMDFSNRSWDEYRRAEHAEEDASRLAGALVGAEIAELEQDSTNDSEG